LVKMLAEEAHLILMYPSDVTVHNGGTHLPARR
jgi:hypothetical protein